MKREFMLAFIVYLVLFLNVAVVEVFGEERDLVTDRPDATESSSTVPKGDWQFEFGYTLEKFEESTNHSMGELLVRYGFSDKLELRFDLGSINALDDTFNTTTEWLDMGVGIKWALIQDHLALIASTSLPVADSREVADHFQPSLVLTGAYDLTDRLSIGSNLGVTFLADSSKRSTEVGFSAVLGYSLTERLGMYVEYFGFYYSNFDFISIGPKNLHYFDGGFTYLVNPLFQLDIRGGSRLKKGVTDYFIGTGAVVRF